VTVSTPTPVNEGTSSYTIDCSASSKPDSNFTWEHNGQEIHKGGPMQNFSLVLAHVTREHYGEYRCNAVNTIDTDSQSTTLVVKCT